MVCLQINQPSCRLRTAQQLVIQWERAFSTLHSSETPRPIFKKLEICNYLPDTTPHAKFQGAMSTWVVWPNSQFDA